MERKQQVRELWKTCFDDSEEFLDLFFGRVYKEENTLAIEKEGRLVCALQMLPYTMTYFGTELSVAYISGACTLPSEQGKGLMKQLLREAFEVMKQRDTDITALIPAYPWLFDFYGKLGYTAAFDYSTEIYSFPPAVDSTCVVSIKEVDEVSTDELYAYFNKKLRERVCCIQHTYDDFITILRDLRQDGGQVLVAIDKDGQLTGAIFFHPHWETESKFYVKELVSDNAETKNALLHKAMSLYTGNQAICDVPPVPGHSHPKGMARIINPERMINVWLSQEMNNLPSGKTLQELDIQTLTHTLLDYQQRLPYMSLMLE